LSPASFALFLTRALLTELRTTVRDAEGDERLGVLSGRVGGAHT